MPWYKASCYSNAVGGENLLARRSDEQDLILEIEEDRVPFNPLDSPPPDITKPIAERRMGGLGIHLVRQLMDSLAYERREGKNYLLTKKRLGEEP
jgi:serine/threonine-protein kinase RsbW